MKDKDYQHLPDHFGMVSRRDFLKFCAVAAASMGLPLGMGVKIAEAVANTQEAAGHLALGPGVHRLHRKPCSAPPIPRWKN